VPNIGRIKVDGLLDQSKAEHLGVEIYVPLWVRGNGGHMVNAVGVDCHMSPVQGNRLIIGFISNA
jgi:hypothetical protein